MHIVKTGLSFLTAALLATSTSLALAQDCNPNIPLTKPDSRYTYNPAGDEVTDSVTGLVWKRCVEGMNWNGSTCTGSFSTFSWEGALAQAASVAQTTGLAWRMPNIKEINSLVETACEYQAINQAVFPVTPDFYMWSGSVTIDHSLGARSVHFRKGVDSLYEKNDPASVRLVRGQ